MSSKIILTVVLVVLAVTAYVTFRPFFMHHDANPSGLRSPTASQAKALFVACIIYQSEHGTWPKALSDLPRTAELTRIVDYQKSQGRSLEQTFRYTAPSGEGRAIFITIPGEYCALSPDKQVITRTDGTVAVE